jgi:glycosyltransferase involved in cell wall biosynthesis
LETFALRHMVREVIAVGWGTAQAQQPRLLNRQVRVIPNAVPIPGPGSRAVRQRARAALVGDSDRLVLLSVGRLEPQKGVFDLLESFALVHHRYPNTCLVMAGSGSLEDQVRAKVALMGLGDAVQLLGLRQDIPDLLAASDLFVSAAHWEGLPVASLEAMAAGLPSVVTAVGDLPRLVVPGTGLLVEPEDPLALAKGIERMLADAGLRQESGAAARDHIKAHYSAAAWADRLLAVYSQVAALKGSERERK